MYEPCMECMHRYDRQYSAWCKENCAYASAVDSLGEYVSELSKYRAAVRDANERLEKMLADLNVKED